VTTLTSREFNQDTSGAKKAARRGPVFITDRGRPAHVLLTIEDYQRLAGGNVSLAEALAQSGDSDFAFKPPRVGGGLFKPADLAGSRSDSRHSQCCRLRASRRCAAQSVGRPGCWQAGNAVRLTTVMLRLALFCHDNVWQND
jgi:prevent-host-death family protein